MSQPTETPQWTPPEHFSAAAHRRMMKRLEAMSQQERFDYLFKISVEAGIYTPDGELTEHYRDSEQQTPTKASEP